MKLFSNTVNKKSMYIHVYKIYNTDLKIHVGLNSSWGRTFLLILTIRRKLTFCEIKRLAFLLLLSIVVNMISTAFIKFVEGLKIGLERKSSDSIMCRLEPSSTKPL